MIKSATIKDVAEKAGVSKGSVWAALKTGRSSIRLSPATRERIQQVARKLNYRPNIVAQSMVSQKSYLIGFSCNNFWYHAVRIIDGLHAICNAHGYSLVIYPAKNVDEEYQNLQQAVNRQLDALLTIPLLTGDRHNGREYCRIAREIMPVVQVCSPLCPDLPAIVHDFRDIGKCASEYLIARGHRDIVLVTFGNYRDSYGGMSSYEHNQGYETAMTAAGLNPRTFGIKSTAGKYAADNAYREAEQILKLSPRPTAIVASSNDAAFGLIRRWEELGIKTPDDISIIGCANDLDIPACLSMGLTRFEDVFDDISKRAFYLCLGQTEQAKQIKPEQFRIKLRLLEGKTVKNL